MMMAPRVTADGVGGVEGGAGGGVLDGRDEVVLSVCASFWSAITASNASSP